MGWPSAGFEHGKGCLQEVTECGTWRLTMETGLLLGWLGGCPGERRGLGQGEKWTPEGLLTEGEATEVKGQEGIGVTVGAGAAWRHPTWVT